MKSTIALSGLATLASAFPSMMNPELLDLSKVKRQDALGISKAQTNCGTLPCPTFDLQDQRVELTGEHRYIAPRKGDIRGLCPGLNAAANQ